MGCQRFVVGAALVAVMAVSDGMGQTVAEICGGLLDNPTDVALIEQLRVLTGRLADEDEKARCGTIYCLSRLAVGDARQGAAVSGHLNKQFPTSPYLKFLFPAYVGFVCPRCEGGGTFRQMCATCGGTGICPRCKGTGKSAIAGFDGNVKSCITCNQTGKCTVCGGAKSVAHACAGCTFGFVASPERAAVTYRALLRHGADGGELPAIPRSTSLRVVLNAMDAAAKQAKQDQSQVVFAAAVARARQQATIAAADAEIRLSGIIQDARDNGAMQVQINIVRFRQAMEDVRDDKDMRTTDWKTIEIVVPAGSAPVFARGASLEIRGRPEFIEGIPGATFPVDCIPIVSAWVSHLAWSSPIGTVIMRDYTCRIGDRVYASPFRKPVQAVAGP